MSGTPDPIQLTSMLVKQFEGFREKAYQDQGGVWTVGFGFTGKDVGPKSTITLEQADARLKEVLKFLWRRLDQDLGRDLNVNQAAAILSLAYNVGLGALERSTLWNMLTDGQLGPAAEQFSRWDHVHGVVSQGLRNRRAAEKALFTSKP